MKYLLKTSIIVIIFAFVLDFVACGNSGLDEYLPAPANNLAGDTLRLVSYNVKAFHNNSAYPDGNYKVIADVLKDLDPDVVCIQELDSVNSRSKGVYQLKQMADLNFWNYRYASTLASYQGGSYGIGIATPQSIVKSSSFLLTSTEEQRGFLIVEFAKYIMVCTHFGGDEVGRTVQAKEVTAKIKELYGKSVKPVFLGGDLNSTPLSDTMKELYKDWILISGQENTCGKSCIDYLLMLNLGNPYKILENRVIGTSSFGNMSVESDHFPILVTIIIP